MNGNNGKAKTKWPLKALRECVVHRSDFIEIDDTTTYRRPRVQLNVRGIVLRDEVSGFDIKTKSQQICRAGDFLVAEIDAKHGGYGLIPQNLNGVIVSSHYFLFELQPERINARFFEWAIRHPNFYVQVVARGSTNYAAIRPHHVLGYEVPLPPMREQERIAAKLDAAAERAGKIRDHLAAQERDLRSLLLAEFWRVSRDAPRRKMREVAPLVRRPIEIEIDRYYPEIAARSFGRGTFQKPPLLGSDLTWQKLFGVCRGDLLFSNIKAWEGAVAVVGDDDDGRFGSHRYLTCVPNAEIVTANFIWFHLLTPEGLRHLGAASPGSADRNRTLGVEKLMNMPVPVPALAQQRAFDALCAKANKIKAHAAQTEADLAALERALLTAAFRGEL